MVPSHKIHKQRDQFPGHGSRAALAATLLLTPLLAFPSAHASERLILNNGFDLVCNHHQVVDGRIRAFLTPGATDYVELVPESLARVEFEPDPIQAPIPAPAPPSAFTPLLAVTKAAAPASIPTSISDQTLTSSELHQLLSPASSEHNVDEDLLAALVKAESGGHTHAKSHAGARGLMQLMPSTAQELGVADSFVPEQNVRGGSAYLDSLLARYHDNIALALAAYNAGPAAVDRYHGIPPYRETRLYVARVVHEFNRRVRMRNAMRNAAGKLPQPVLRASLRTQNQRLGSE